MKVQIKLNNVNDAKKFNFICETLPGNIAIIDRNGFKVNAKSLFGVLYALEFNELWCDSENDITNHIREFIVHK